MTDIFLAAGIDRKPFAADIQCMPVGGAEDGIDGFRECQRICCQSALCTSLAYVMSDSQGRFPKPFVRDIQSNLKPTLFGNPGNRGCQMHLEQAEEEAMEGRPHSSSVCLLWDHEQRGQQVPNKWPGQVVTATKSAEQQLRVNDVELLPEAVMRHKAFAVTLCVAVRILSTLMLLPIALYAIWLRVVVGCFRFGETGAKDVEDRVRPDCMRVLGHFWNFGLLCAATALLYSSWRMTNQLGTFYVTFIGTVMCFCFAALSIIVSFRDILKHLQNYTQPTRQRRIIRILLMVPIYAMSAFVGTYYAMAGGGEKQEFIPLACTTFRGLYESFTLYNFSAYIVESIEAEALVKELLEHGIFTGKPPVHVSKAKHSWQRAIRRVMMELPGRKLDMHVFQVEVDASREHELAKGR